MFARLLKTSRLLDVTFEASKLPASGDKADGLVVDLNALQNLVCFFPRNLAGMCNNTVSPIYTNVRELLSSDIENITALLSDLERRHDESLDLSESPVSSINTGICASEIGFENPSDVASEELHPSKSSRSISQRLLQTFDSEKRTITIPSSHPEAPTIVITLCPPQSKSNVCRVPYQNSAFGSLLTVPSYSAFNEAYPPMMPDSYSSLARLRGKWIWNHGHWEAVVPSLEEQVKKGLFSKIKDRKRKNRAFSAT